MIRPFLLVLGWLAAPAVIACEGSSEIDLIPNGTCLFDGAQAECDELCKGVAGTAWHSFQVLGVMLAPRSDALQCVDGKAAPMDFKLKSGRRVVGRAGQGGYLLEVVETDGHRHRLR